MTSQLFDVADCEAVVLGAVWVHRRAAHQSPWAAAAAGAAAAAALLCGKLGGGCCAV